MMTRLLIQDAQTMIDDQRGVMEAGWSSEEVLSGLDNIGKKFFHRRG